MITKVVQNRLSQLFNNQLYNDYQGWAGSRSQMSRSLRQKGRCNKIDQEDKYKQHFIGLIAYEIFVEEQQTSFSVFFLHLYCGFISLDW